MIRKALAVFVLVVVGLFWSAPGALASVQTRTCKPAASSFNSTLTTNYTLGVSSVYFTTTTGSNPYSLSTNKIYLGSDASGVLYSKSGTSSVSRNWDTSVTKAAVPWTRLISTYNGTSCTVTFRPAP